MSRILTVQDCFAHLGETVTPKGQHRALTLVSVDTAGPRGNDGTTREPFTLILCGPPDDVLPEGLYDVALANQPDFALYIIPIHTVARDRQNYQVVFN
jgi:hypothetical protein